MKTWSPLLNCWIKPCRFRCKISHSLDETNNSRVSLIKKNHLSFTWWVTSWTCRSDCDCWIWLSRAHMQSAESSLWFVMGMTRGCSLSQQVGMGWGWRGAHHFVCWCVIKVWAFMYESEIMRVCSCTCTGNWKGDWKGSVINLWVDYRNVLITRREVWRALWNKGHAAHLLPGLDYNR